jgi:hypothetical protein
MLSMTALRLALPWLWPAPHNVHAEAQVGVETDYGPPHSANDSDRPTVEAELADKGLPEGFLASCGLPLLPHLVEEKTCRSSVGL